MRSVTCPAGPAGHCLTHAAWASSACRTISCQACTISCPPGAALLARRVVFTHETVRERAARFAPLLSACLRAKRRGQAGTKWHADETYVKVAGRQRYYPMRGFGSFASAARFCPAFEEQRQYLRPRTMMGRYLPLADQRHLFQDRWTAVLAELGAT